MGGVIFPDEADVEAWVRRLGEEDAHWFAVDMFSLFLLADTRYETVSQGLQQTATEGKTAQFTSINIATIDLSYGMHYPRAMLRTSDKVEAQATDGIVWGPVYASHDVFQGEYNNGTHQRTKQAISHVGKSIQEGREFHFPVRTHPQPNAVFSSLLHISTEQCHGLLDAQTPLFNQINGGVMSPKDAWNWNLAFTKAVFDHILIVRSPNSEATVGSKIWCSLHTARL